MGWWWGSTAREEKALAAAELVRQQEENAMLKARLEALEKPSSPEAMLEQIVPFGSQMLFGSTLGYTSGYALRVAGKVASVAIGSGFIFVQCLSYLGYIAVDWRKVERDYIMSLDRDGDGEITTNDLSLLFGEAKDVLAFNLPAGSGFAGGLLYGLNAASLTAAGSLATVGGFGARFILPRVALGGAGALATPAIIVSAKRGLGFGDNAADGTSDAAKDAKK